MDESSKILYLSIKMPIDTETLNISMNHYIICLLLYEQIQTNSMYLLKALEFLLKQVKNSSCLCK